MKTLEWISSEIKARHIQICNDYPNFFRTIASIANEYGEAGRNYARIICMESNSFSDKAFDYQYSYCLKHQYNRITGGTLYHLCQQAGLDIKQLYDTNIWKQWEWEFDLRKQDKIISKAERDYFNYFNISPNTSSHAGMRAYDNIPNQQAKNAKYLRNSVVPADEMDDCVEYPLPPLVENWSFRIPKILRKIVDVYDVEAEKEAAMMSAIALLSFFISDKTWCLYGGSKYHPAILLLICGDSASSKGSVSKTFALLDAANDRAIAEYDEAMKVYDNEMENYSNLGKERQNHPTPKKPVMRCPRIAVDSSGASTMQSIDECNGHVVLLSTEMSEMTTAQSSEYGKQNSAILRISFDHDKLMMRRRKNDEYIIIKNPILTFILTGTKEQLKELTQTAENGQFSRGMYIFMPNQDEFRDLWGIQFDVKNYFRSIGDEWEKLINKRLEGTYDIEMVFSREQQITLTNTYRALNKDALMVSDEMVPYVRRAIINTIRIMTGFAFIRAMEDWGTDRCLLKPRLIERTDKGESSIENGWTLNISDEDYHWILSMADPLFEHASHAYSYLDRHIAKSNKLREASIILRAMPDQFTTREFINMGISMGYLDPTLRTWLNRAKSAGMIESIAQGVYVKKKIGKGNKRNKGNRGKGK